VTLPLALRWAACADIPENPVRNSGTRTIIRVSCRLTQAGRFSRNGLHPERYFGTAANLPAELAAAKSNARAVRLTTNRALSCQACLGQPAGPTESRIPP